MPKLPTSLLALLLAGCSTQANHIGNPLTLPFRLVGATLSNAAYDARRKDVSDFVAGHHSLILRQAADGIGPDLTSAMNLAGVPPDRRPALTAELATNPLYLRDAEALVVALMVHGV